MSKRVKREYNGGTWTSAQKWSAIRSCLRKRFRYWIPATRAKIKSRREYSGPLRRQKWEYQCNSCKQFYPEKEINIDHIIPVGSLKGPEDLVGFIERLLPESEDAFQVLCKSCHKEKTLIDNKKMKEEK